MVDVEYALDRFVMNVDQDQRNFSIKDSGGSPLLVDTVGKIDVHPLHNTTRVSGVNVIQHAYQITIQYTPGALEVHLNVFKLFTSNVIGVVTHTSRDSLRANVLPMVLLPISNKDDEVTYDVIMPSFGAASVVSNTILSERIVLPNAFSLSRSSGNLLATGATALNYSDSNLVANGTSTNTTDMVVAIT